MSALRGAMVGFLGLTLLEATVSNDKAVNNTSGLIKLAAGAIDRLVNPTVPLIPDRRKPGNHPLAL